MAHRSQQEPFDTWDLDKTTNPLFRIYPPVILALILLRPKLILENGELSPVNTTEITNYCRNVIPGDNSAFAVPKGLSLHAFLPLFLFYTNSTILLLAMGSSFSFISWLVTALPSTAAQML